MATKVELEGLAHDHDFLGSQHDRNARRTLWVVALTALMMVGEITAGVITGSMALLADGGATAQGLIQRVDSALGSFIADAAQFDDIAMFAARRTP